MFNVPTNTEGLLAVDDVMHSIDGTLPLQVIVSIWTVENCCAECVKWILSESDDEYKVIEPNVNEPYW